METAAEEQLVKVPLTNCSLAAVTGDVSITSYNYADPC